MTTHTEEEICPTCMGSGEGMTETSNCRNCKGSGVVLVEVEDENRCQSDTDELETGEL